MINGLSYGAYTGSIAYPIDWAWKQERAKARATTAYKLAVAIYTEEWETMSPLVRPSVPNVAFKRAYNDGFISLDDWNVLEPG